MNALMLAAWLVSIDCGPTSKGKEPLLLDTFADQKTAMDIASGTFDHMSDDLKLHCIVIVKELH